MAGIITVNSVYASATDASRLATAYITTHYVSKLGRPDAVRVASQDQLLAAIKDTAGTLTLLLGALADISLLGGGIGIMNIMLVSVSERRREIGICRALGAKKRDILAQFLIESTMLCLAGAGLGILLGLAGSWVVHYRAGGTRPYLRARSSLPLVSLSAWGCFSACIPRRGPIQALRNE